MVKLKTLTYVFLKTHLHSKFPSDKILIIDCLYVPTLNIATVLF